jgi:hypothetical protein
MKITIRIGQVWKRKGEGFNQRICIGAINTELNKIWVNGLGEMVDPIITYEYLDKTFELEAGWEI